MGYLLSQSDRRETTSRGYIDLCRTESGTIVVLNHTSSYIIRSIVGGIQKNNTSNDDDIASVLAVCAVFDTWDL